MDRMRRREFLRRVGIGAGALATAHAWPRLLLPAARAQGAGTLTYAMRHYAVIERFGRFPHRNAILGRESSPDELAFLAQPGSSF